MWQNRLGNLFLTVWMGTHWTAGYVVAPVLFKSLDDRQLAGMLAGQVFNIAAWVGLVAGLLLLVQVIVQDKVNSFRAWRFWLLSVMFALVAIGAFVVQPQMAALKAQGIIAGTDAASAFGRMHGISSIMHMVISVSGLILVWLGLHSTQARPRSALGTW